VSNAKAPLSTVGTVGADRPSAKQKNVTGRPKRVGQLGDWVGIFRSNDAEETVKQVVSLF
jgi:hypothetical protein